MRPTPPPNVNPATPVSATVPTGVTSPNASASRSSWPSSAPASTRATRALGSTSTARMGETSMTSPPSHPD